jgi:hypothetical protein
VKVPFTRACVSSKREPIKVREFIWKRDERLFKDFKTMRLGKSSFEWLCVRWKVFGSLRASAKSFSAITKGYT